MAEAAASITLAEPPKRKGLAKRLLLPVLLLLLGAGAGAGGTLFLAPLLTTSAAPKAAAPKVAPLEYVEIDNSFTSNLRDTGRFVQVKIAVSTQGGKPVVEAVERHKLAIIAAVLDVLADTTEEELASPGGRDALARRMRAAINATLQRKSGVTGIDDVYLTSLVTQ